MNAPCGTYAAATRHVRRDEELDQDCLDARREYLRDWQRAKRVTEPGLEAWRMSTLREKARETVFTRYAPAGIRRCFCCGSPFGLTIDHVNGDGAEHRERALGARNTAGWHQYRLLIRAGLPDGFTLLCFSCNASKGSGTRCRKHEGEGT